MIAYYSHDAQRLDVKGSRVEVDIARASTVVSKDNIRMDVGIEITYALVVSDNYIGERRGILCVCRTSTTPIISWTSLFPITVDIHISKLTTWPLYIDHTIVGDMVTTIRESCSPETKG
jgi:hypothetical protein